MERRFSPLDERLRLRADRWSEGAAQVACEQGLGAQSFRRAAAAYTRAVGGDISADSVRRITQQFGDAVAQRREQEAECAMALPEKGEAADQQRIEPVAAVEKRANLSTDGVFVLVRNEGWKEVKLSVVSALEVEEASQRTQTQRRRDDPLVHLTAHSYQAGLWDADTMARFQYAEGLRRGLDQVEVLTSVNDAAPWIERITGENFPQAIQIVDWTHAAQRIGPVAQQAVAAHQRKQWTETQLNRLWEGNPTQVAQAIARLPSAHEEVRQAQGYFQDNAHRMRYAAYRTNAYPIGSGVVESGAKNVVQHRMKRPGRGWNRPTAQAMLAALSELASDRFDLAWRQAA